MWRRLLALCLCSACGHSGEGTSGYRPAYAAEAILAAPQSKLAVASEADVLNWSHALLAAYDRGELAVLELALSPQLTHFEGKPRSRSELLEGVKARTPDDAHVGERSWTDEHVVSGAQGAVFTGKATEHSVGNESHGGDEFVGWYNLVWVPAGDRYQVLYWSYATSGSAMVRASWDARYEHGTGFNHEPNELLVDVTEELKPGAALDLAMGQGRNALFLASEGWQVTGVDYSAEATRQASAQAKERELELQVIQQDIDVYDFGVAKWDLVTMIYATDNLNWIERSKRALKHGGMFVYEYFDGGPEGVSSDKLGTLFTDGFEILQNDVVHASPDWAQDRAKIIRFVAQRR